MDIGLGAEGGAPSHDSGRTRGSTFRDVLGIVSQSGDESRGFMKIELQFRAGRERRDKGDEGDVVTAGDRGLDNLDLLLGGVYNGSLSTSADSDCTSSG